MAAALVGSVVACHSEVIKNTSINKPMQPARMINSTQMSSLAPVEYIITPH